jgi:hypothetical protein
METTKLLLSAASEQASLIDERFEGYRALIVKRLASVIQTQEIGGSQSARQNRVQDNVVTAAEQVAARLEEPTP